MTGTLTEETLKGYSKAFHASPKNRLAQNAMTHVDFGQVAMCRNTYNQIDHTFSHQVQGEGKATSQKRSGRCWLFAALNTMRLPLMKKYKLEDFEFSQSHLFFWDKVEKSNYFLESIIQTRKEDLKGRLMHWILRQPMEDGGQWHMFVSLINKYGVMPKSVMPETFSSSNSARLNTILDGKLRECAVKLRKMSDEGDSLAKLRTKKKEMMGEIYRIITIFLGEPPERFDWSFRDKDKKFKCFKNLTPQQFLKKHVPYKQEDKVCLIHAPTSDKPLNRLFSIQHLGNVVGGEDIQYINAPIDVLRNAAIASLKKGEAVWFGCDVGKELDRKLGVMDHGLFDYDLVLDTKIELTKGERLDYGESLMTHAMVLTGVDIPKTRPVKWRVENSWGDDLGSKGYFLMSDQWFDEFLYEIVVDKKYVPKKILDILAQRPIVLPPWDPMGSLAH